MKLALIGKDIQHSKSPEVYKSLLNFDFTYDLLDFSSSDLIPQIDDLLSNYHGVNITSPYKKSYLLEVKLDVSSKKTEAINCLFRKNKLYFGANTDYLALQKLIPSFNKKKFVILGNGVMANVVSLILHEQNFHFTKYFRTVSDDIDQLNLTDHNNSLIINCCSRDYNFQGKLSNDSIFWDLNYSHQKNYNFCTDNSYNYIDGYNLLVDQARQALTFWSL